MVKIACSLAVHAYLLAHEFLARAVRGRRALHLLPCLFQGAAHYASLHYVRGYPSGVGLLLMLQARVIATISQYLFSERHIKLVGDDI